jgi:hypothetical protein
MRLLAFKLVAFVVGFQLLIVGAVLAGCLVTRDDRCTGENSSKLLASIGAQAFALYAAEK